MHEESARSDDPHMVFPRDKEWALGEYQEAAQVFRGIDTRIWSIYGLYLGGLGAATVYVLTKSSELDHVAILALSIACIITSLGQIAMVAHLLRASDIVAFRLREVEEHNNLDTHRRFTRDIPPNLWGLGQVPFSVEMHRLV